MEAIESHPKGKYRTIGFKTCLKDVSDGITTSKELLKVLNHVCGLDEKHPSGLSLVSALRIELNRACILVNQLIKEHRSNHNEIEYLIKHFEEEKAAWKSKERDRIRNATACIAEELEVERKLRSQTERLNKKLGKELADTKISLSKAVKELECEKRAKEVLEQVCDELARGIGEDRAAAEEMKKESAKMREEVEKEREMLQLADVFREERVQMKLCEAKYHFEEKNCSCGQAEREENEMGAIGNGEVHDGDDSADSDLHSIELNMDNSSRSYKWCYVSEGNALDNPKWFSGGKDFKGRKSISDNIQWGNICLQTRNSNGIDGPDHDFINENQGCLNMLDRERTLPVQRPVLGQSLPLQESGNLVSDDTSPVRQEDNLKPRIA
ncbi:hypothetical protein OIU84_009608 [Salix udensis]|uniref:Uncharacterized protein n=1 Tax=Salix udensis TaxID=889485 RepID=A0AAD6NYW4_9ROSI|nr:hypothetical protein OIU84_009608 [Salix udensis]